jgi:hypothetical protein
VRSDEVEDRACALPGGLAETASELLQEERRTVRWTEEQEGVDVRDVDALVEKVDREDDAHLPIRKVVQRCAALFPTARRGEGDCR